MTLYCTDVKPAGPLPTVRKDRFMKTAAIRRITALCLLGSLATKPATAKQDVMIVEDYSKLPANTWVLIHSEDNSGGKAFARLVLADNVDRLYLWGTGGKKPARNVFLLYETWITGNMVDVLQISPDLVTAANKKRIRKILIDMVEDERTSGRTRELKDYRHEGITWMMNLPARAEHEKKYGKPAEKK